MNARMPICILSLTFTKCRLILLRMLLHINSQANMLRSMIIPFTLLSFTRSVPLFYSQESEKPNFRDFSNQLKSSPVYLNSRRGIHEYLSPNFPNVLPYQASNIRQSFIPVRNTPGAIPLRTSVPFFRNPFLADDQYTLINNTPETIPLIDSSGNFLGKPHSLSDQKRLENQLEKELKDKNRRKLKKFNANVRSKLPIRLDRIRADTFPRDTEISKNRNFHTEMKNGNFKNALHIFQKPVFKAGKENPNFENKLEIQGVSSQSNNLSNLDKKFLDVHANLLPDKLGQQFTFGTFPVQPNVGETQNIFTQIRNSDDFILAAPAGIVQSNQPRFTSVPLENSNKDQAPLINAIFDTENNVKNIIRYADFPDVIGETNLGFRESTNLENSAPGGIVQSGQPSFRFVPFKNSKASNFIDIFDDLEPQNSDLNFDSLPKIIDV